MTRGLLIVTGAVVLCATPRVVAADDAARAKALHKQATQLTRDQRFADAINLYKQSQRLHPRWTRLCNIGLAYKKLKSYHRTEYFLARCKSAAGTAFPATMRTLADTVEQQLEAGNYAMVHITTRPATATIIASAFAPDEPLRSGERFWVPLGRLRLDVRAPGTTARTVTIDVTARGAMHQRTIELAPTITAVPVAKPAMSPADSAPPKATAPPISAPVTPPTDARGPRKRGVLTWALLGGGVVTLAGGGLFHALALRSRNDAEALPPRPADQPYPEFDALQGDYERRRNISIGLYAVGGIVTAYAIYRVVRAPRAQRSPAITATPTRGGAAVVGRWRF